MMDEWPDEVWVSPPGEDGHTMLADAERNGRRWLLYVRGGRYEEQVAMHKDACDRIAELEGERDEALDKVAEYENTVHGARGGAA